MTVIVMKITNYQIDQTRTFSSVLFLGCEPKAVFGDSFRQETTKDGLGKYLSPSSPWSSGRSAGNSAS